MTISRNAARAALAGEIARLTSCAGTLVLVSCSDAGFTDRAAGGQPASPSPAGEESPASGDGSAVDSEVGTAPRPPIGLTLTHVSGHRRFTVSWAAGQPQKDCRLEFLKDGTE